MMNTAIFPVKFRARVRVLRPAFRAALLLALLPPAAFA